MKSIISIVALILALAVLTPAFGASYTFSFTGSNPALPTGVVTQGTQVWLDASHTIGFLASTAENYTTSGGFHTGVNLYENSNGLGVSGGTSTNDIGEKDYIVLDFTQTPAQVPLLTSISFTLTMASYYAGDIWKVFEQQSVPTSATDLFASGAKQYGNLQSGVTTITVPAISLSALQLGQNPIFVIALDCGTNSGAIDLKSLTLNYGVPEPATFVLMGVALTGLGIFLKKRHHKG